jgi:hypothetical protein
MGKSFATSIRIQASPDRVWAILVDAPSWPTWNTTVDKVDGTIASGNQVTVHARISPGRSFPVNVAVFDAPSRMVWSSGMPLGLFKGERTFTLAPAEGGTEFAMREQFTGPLSPLIGMSIPDLQPAFEKFAACLKKHAEATG